MARAGRKRHTEAKRHPNGSVVREDHSIAVKAARALQSGILKTASDPAIESFAGRMFLEKKLGPKQYEAAKRFVTIYDDYFQQYIGRNPHPRANVYHPAVRSTADEWTPEDLAKSERAYHRFVDAMEALGEDERLKNAAISVARDEGCNGMPQYARQAFTRLAVHFKIMQPEELDKSGGLAA